MNDKVVEAAQRLLDNADVIKQAVDLKGACIALDDCYEVGASNVQQLFIHHDHGQPAQLCC